MMYKFWCKAVCNFLAKVGMTPENLSKIEDLLRNNKKHNTLPGRAHDGGFLLKIDNKVYFCPPIREFKTESFGVNDQEKLVQLQQQLALVNEEPDFVVNINKQMMIDQITTQIAELTAKISAAEEAE